MNADLITAALRVMRAAPKDEKELQFRIADALARAGVMFEREVESGAGRVDFVVGSSAVEVKINGSAVAIMRQLFRYAKAGLFSEIILITTRALSLPPALETPHGSVPLTVISLWKQFL